MAAHVINLCYVSTIGLSFLFTTVYLSPSQSLESEILRKSVIEIVNVTRFLKFDLNSSTQVVCFCLVLLSGKNRQGCLFFFPLCPIALH